ncbi:XAC2610-related protein [Stenotrophomonas sp. 22385]|uniref:XAC2610-related protein n=1 Tax=Stenotrophomonas sp. 22385 TaxID=3453915 RepID=UPI003F86230C
MRIRYAALLPALLIARAEAGPLLEPGIYQLSPEAPEAETAAAPAAGEIHHEALASAIPDAAKVRYAFVSRDPGKALNKLVFVTDGAYRYDINSANRLCPAYAFPDWNERSDAQPFCRTHIGSADTEAALAWTERGFTLRWADQKTLIRTEQVAATRKPSPDEIGACAVGGVCVPAAYGSVLQHYQVTHFRDGFSLQAPRPYIDVFAATVDTPVYRSAEDGTASGTLAAGRYAGVLSRGAEWIGIEEVAAGGATTPGWIRRDDLAGGELRFPQQATTAHLRFVLVVAPADDDQALLQAIDILDATTGQRRQILRDIDAEPLSAGPDVVQLLDANFDGWPDLSVPGYSGGAGPNATRNLFLFDPAAQAFMFEPTLSSLPQMDIDPATRTLTSASRGGCCAHATETYRYVDGKLQQVASWEESLSPDGEHLQTTEGTLRNGTMKYRTRTRKLPADWR